MGWDHKRRLPARRPALQRTARHGFRPRLEPLEPRALLAVLGLDIQLLRDEGGQPGAAFSTLSDVEHGPAATDPLTEGDFFWVQVLAWDERGTSGTAPGVIALPLSLAWDPAFLIYMGEQPDGNTGPNAAADPDIAVPNSADAKLLTPIFPEQRFLRDYDGTANAPNSLNSFASPTNANLLNLRGAVVPGGAGAAIGQLGPTGTDAMPSWFSRLRFMAVADTEQTPFAIQLAGSMSFGDADALDQIVHVVADDSRSGADQFNRVIEQIVIAAETSPPEGLSSLAGCVFLDTNPTDGMFNRVGGVPVEIGVPGVTITLVGTQLDGTNVSRTTTTNADGSYRFDDLAAGTYQVIETQPPSPPFIDGPVAVGTIDGLPAGVAGANEIHQIVLAEGQDGVDYCFGEFVAPDKRMFLATTDTRVLMARQAGVPAQAVRATSAPDHIVIQAAANRLLVTIDNAQAPQQYSVPLSQARVLYVHADEDDTVEFHGTPAAEVAQLTPGASTLRLGENYHDANFALMAVAAQELLVDGGQGNDFAVLYDSPDDDALTAAGDSALVAWPGNGSAEAIAFEQVRAISLLRPSATENDTLHESLTDFALEAVGSWN